MNKSRLNVFTVLFAVAFLLGLLVRLVGASQLALTDPEAALALQALSLSRGQGVSLSPQPAYLVLTTAWMTLFSATNFVARFWPAFAGSLLVLLPALFQRRFGNLPALIMAFGLAFDPGLMATSRQVGSLPLALFFTILAAGLWLQDRRVWAGIALALALLSGPAIWPGLVGLLVAAWVIPGAWQVESNKPIETRPIIRQGMEGDDEVGVDDRSQPVTASNQPAWRAPLIALLATLFFAGTLFFSIPSGLSAMAGSLPAYLSGWVAQSGVPVRLVLVALLVYEFFPLLLGLWRGVMGLLHGDALDRFLLVWWAVALVLALAYPDRQVADLSWSIVPLWGLAARQIGHLLSQPFADPDDVLPTWGQALLAVVIITFISMGFLGMINNPQNMSDPLQLQQYEIRLVGAVVMLLASAGLIWWGWSQGVAGRGLSWALLAVLGVYSFSAAWDASGLSSHRNRDFWNGNTIIENADLVLQSIQTLRHLGPAVAGGADLVVVDVNSPALRWALRQVETVSYADQLPNNASPAMVITQDKPNLALSATYRGEGYNWNEKREWTGLTPSDWFLWAAFRTVPDDILLRDRIILWGRIDLFPGGQATEQQPVP